MNGSKKSVCALVLTSALAIFLIFPRRFLQAQTADSWPSAQEAARRTRDESQLQALKTRLERSLDQNPNDAQTHYRLAEVQGYLADVYEARKDKKSARTAVDQGIEATLRSLQFNEKSADAHSLLADLYGRKISLGNGMFAGPRYGPKVDEENKRAMALDDKNPRVWASLGRQYLMTPKRFGGDLPKAVESFQKSVSLDPSQDETWVWLAKAYDKQGDQPKARDAVQHALQLNPENQFAKSAAAALQE
jgi:tetratricopeptide (TPR) repeat protein